MELSAEGDGDEEAALGKGAKRAEEKVAVEKEEEVLTRTGPGARGMKGGWKVGVEAGKVSVEMAWRFWSAEWWRFAWAIMRGPERGSVVCVVGGGGGGGVSVVLAWVCVLEVSAVVAGVKVRKGMEKKKRRRVRRGGRIFVARVGAIRMGWFGGTPTFCTVFLLLQVSRVALENSTPRGAGLIPEIAITLFSLG